ASMIDVVDERVDQQREEGVHDDGEQERDVEHRVAVHMRWEDATERCGHTACTAVDPLGEATARIGPEQLQHERKRCDHDRDDRERVDEPDDRSADAPRDRPGALGWPRLVCASGRFGFVRSHGSLLTDDEAATCTSAERYGPMMT